VTVTVDDLFCGAGGSSLGGELAGARLRIGLNHWNRAVEAANFQHADHDCAEISALTTSHGRCRPRLPARCVAVNAVDVEGGR
jgi:site-specific DNA-cytosine methylase